MPVQRAFFTVTGSTDVKIRLTENYTPIAADLGLTAVALSDPGQPISSSEAKVRRLVSTIRITVVDGKKRRSHLIACAADKEDTALTTLTGKTFGTRTIVSCGYPRRAVYR